METKKTLRPSSIGSYLNCQWQWYNVHILGMNTIPSARATIGTAIHKSAEVMWTEAMAKGEKDLNLSMLEDVAVEEYKNLDQDLSYDEGENSDTAIKEVLAGTKAFTLDIAPKVDIPKAVEKFYEFKIDNPIFERVGGSIDYVGDKIVGDIKTSKRKPTLTNYNLQQATYAVLREKNGEDVEAVQIQSIVLGKKTATGAVFDLIADSTKPFDTLDMLKNQSKYVINNILKKVTFLDKAPETILFTGNPKNNLCSPKYCNLYETCPFVKGSLV